MIIDLQHVFRIIQNPFNKSDTIAFEISEECIYKFYLNNMMYQFRSDNMILIDCNIMHRIYHDNQLKFRHGGSIVKKTNSVLLKQNIEDVILESKELTKNNCNQFVEQFYKVNKIITNINFFFEHKLNYKPITE